MEAGNLLLLLMSSRHKCIYESNNCAVGAPQQQTITMISFHHSRARARVICLRQNKLLLLYLFSCFHHHTAMVQYQHARTRYIENKKMDVSELDQSIAYMHHTRVSHAYICMYIRINGWMDNTHTHT